ncbi:unnamed protein product [Nesidiocoris tenuis]|uniref:Uncharacterized protein n=1 Tax=Nesidiocoris tenuis TaxID=355587 RepID=A0A6H5GXQ3_9HEMI|nr:unnamed protein product [Nesidiocoris tenuis]
MDVKFRCENDVVMVYNEKTTFFRVKNANEKCPFECGGYPYDVTVRTRLHIGMIFKEIKFCSSNANISSLESNFIQLSSSMIMSIRRGELAEKHKIQRSEISTTNSDYHVTEITLNDKTRVII